MNLAVLYTATNAKFETSEYCSNFYHYYFGTFQFFTQLQDEKGQMNSRGCLSVCYQT